MTKLPSGRRAGITNIRARYHATRRNLKIDAETPMTTLMELVDIVEWPDEREAGINRKDFTFSGHTLADFPHLEEWDDDDLELFLAWLEDPSQYRLVEKARQRVVMDDLPLKVHQYHYPQKLYSTLEQRLNDLDLRQAGVAQWQGTLSNMQKDGLKPDEALWSGLDHFLAGQPSDTMLSRDELLGAIDFSPIRLDVTNELVGGGSCGLQFEEHVQLIPHQTMVDKGYRLENGERGQIRYWDNGYRYRVGMLRGGAQWFLLDPSGLALNGEGEQEATWFDSAEQAMTVAGNHARRRFKLDLEYRPCSRYEHKSLCGGEDYREWLVSLPDYADSFFGSHYYERNLLLHFRTKQRRDQQGRRLLFIEELQSDWHQSGAMKGYQNRWPGIIPVAPFRREWVGLALKLMLMHVAEHDFDGIAWTNGREQELHYNKEMEPVRRLYDQEIPRFLQRLGSPWQIEIERTAIATKEPKLHAKREGSYWMVLDQNGGFQTKPRYSHQEALEVMSRHCRSIDLDIPVCLIPDEMKQAILENGLPLFGERHIADRNRKNVK